MTQTTGTATLSGAGRTILARTRARYGDQADMSEVEACHETVKRFHGTGTRVKVTATCDNGETFTRTGTVSNTTGWRPALLLMHRSNARGSWDVLRPRDRVVAVWNGRRYVDL